jgi:hypothetical protein
VGEGSVAADGSRVSKSLLFSEEKRSKKDFTRLRPRARVGANEEKFFGSFFQKRTRFLT